MNEHPKVFRIATGDGDVECSCGSILFKFDAPDASGARPLVCAKCNLKTKDLAHERRKAV